MSVPKSAIQLRSGKFFDYLKMDQNDILITDIAHALSLQCRFNGHVEQFYSVAQHSVIVSYFVQKRNALVGLMHDATEAYIGDMAAPLKKLIPEFAQVEDDVWTHIAQKYDLPYEIPLDVRMIDKRACITEAMDLMGVEENAWGWNLPRLDCDLIIPLEPRKAKALFHARFRELTISQAA